MKLKSVFIVVAVALLLWWVLFPVYWILNLSFQTEDEIHTRPPHYLPPNPSGFSYWAAFRAQSILEERLQRESGALYLFTPGAVKDFPQSIINSVVVASVVLGYNVAAGLLASFAITRIRFKGGDQTFYLAIAGRLIPPIVIAVPYYVIIRSIGLLDNIISIILVHIFLTLPLTIWILNTYLLTIPIDMEDAARVDGYSYFEILRKVTFPLIKPAIVVIAITSFMTSYSEFFFALLLTKSAAARTIPVVIGSSASIPFAVKGIISTMGVITMAAPVAIVVIFRRYLIRGLVAGAVK